MTDRKYVRVYYNDLIRDYPDVYADREAVGCWLELLVVAEAMWPTPADLPGWARGRAFRVLIDSGLVEVGPPGRFLVRGHVAERTRRQDAAKAAAAKRWQNGGIADA
jgi:hypothetical protein